MKIAVQIFGHMRTFEKCYSSLRKYLLSKYDCDVFIHTWDSLDHSTKTWHKYKPNNGKFNIELIKKCYEPKVLKVESQKVEDLGTINALGNDISIYGIKSMLYSMNTVNDLRLEYEKKENIKYDFVVFVRPDVNLYKDFDINSFIKHFSEGELQHIVFHAGNKLYNNYDLRFVTATDILFFSKPDVFNNMFKNYENIMILKNGMNIEFGPEYLFCLYEEKHKIKPVLIDYLFGDCFEIIRLKSFSMNKIIKLTVNRYEIKFYLFQFLKPIILIQCNLFNCFKVFFSIGKLKDI